MPLPVLHGVIRRRILVSFRVDPEVAQRQLPAPFRPKQVGGAAIAGLCLIRLEQVRPPFLPWPVGLHSENAAHRFAVCWTDAAGVERDGVYISRRDTGSLLNHMAGGRLFPGAAHRARFDVRDAEGRIDFTMRSEDGAVSIGLIAHVSEEWPADSCFDCLEEASDFYRAGSVGYSPARGGGRLEGMALETETWRVQPLVVEAITAGAFADPRQFPPGSVVLDSALLMRDIPHAWRSEPCVIVA